MTDRMTYEELDAKIEWEGGIRAALSYGVAASDVPLDLEYIWSELIYRHKAFNRTWDYVGLVIEREVKREQSASGS